MTMHVRLLKILLCAIPFVAGIAFADPLPTSAVATGDAVIRDNQLREIRDILRGGRGGYLDFGFNYLPVVTQTQLQSEYGVHDGFAFRQHFAGFGAGAVDKNQYVGFLLWFERSGWDAEDFFLFPRYSEFAAVRSMTTWGLTYTQKAMDLTLAAGMQHLNVEYMGRVYPDESDSLAYSWAHARWRHMSVQGSFYRTDWRSLRVSLDLESRSAYGGRKSGLMTYLPNLEMSLYNGGDDGDDSVRVKWEQNLFDQRFYGEVTFDFPDKGFHSAALKYYPDPSRMIGFEATCLRRGETSGSKDLLWGGAIDLLFVRLAYNSSYEYEHLFHAKGTFIAEIKFDLAMVDGFLFNRGAARPAPMEASVFSRKNKDTNPEFKGKTLEASGIRYEKTGAPAASEGGK